MTKTTKWLLSAALSAVLVMPAAFAFAQANTWHINTYRNGVDNVAYDIDDPATGQDHVMIWDVTSGYQSWLNPARFQSEFLDAYYNYVKATTLSAATSSLQSQIDSLQSQVGGSSFNVTAFMANQASTSPLVASSTFNGFMSAAMFTKLSGLSTSTVSTTTAGLMSATDKSKLDALSTTTTQGGSCTSDSSGNCTVTFGTAFASTPKVAVTAVQGTNATLTNAQVSSKSSSSVTIHVNTVAMILGLLTLTTNPSGIVVDIVATTQ